MSAQGSPLPIQPPHPSGDSTGTADTTGTSGGSGIVNTTGTRGGSGVSGTRGGSGGSGGSGTAGDPPAPAGDPPAFALTGGLVEDGRSRGAGFRAAVGAAVLPLLALAAGGSACAWAVRRASQPDRLLVAVTGALAAVLLGAAGALAGSRRRTVRRLRLEAASLREETARSLALHAEATRRAAAEVDTARRSVRSAEVHRRAAAEAQASLLTALHAETARVAALEDETARLAEVTLPQAAEQLRAGGSAGTVLARLPRPAGQAHQRLLGTAVREVGASERARAAAMAACAGAAARMQALTTAMLADLRELEQLHDERVLDDLLRLDHSTAQAGRLADSVAVLSGSRSGRRWTRPIPMESVLRGAMGRIHAYQRVRLHTAGASAVAGHAAEGVMHVLAELMDNACNFSPPSEEVHVYVQESHSGVVVTVEDAGLGMPESALARAELLVSGGPQDIPPGPSGTRLGLTVVGRLARKHRLRVSFRPSSRGGTGVVVLIPSKLVTRDPEAYGGFERPQGPVPVHDSGRTSGYSGGPGGYDSIAGGRTGADARTGAGATSGAGAGGRAAAGAPGGGGIDAGAGSDGFPEPAGSEEIGHAGPVGREAAAARQPGTAHAGGRGGGHGGGPELPLPRRTRGRAPAPEARRTDVPGEERGAAAAPARGAASAGARFGAFREAATGRDRRPPRDGGGVDSEG